jgi:hypothetical protein
MRIMMHSIETKLSRNIQEVLRGNDWERIWLGWAKDVGRRRWGSRIH